MWDVVVNVVGGLLLVPFLFLLLFLIIAKRLGKSPAKVFGIAVDMTTPFVFYAVAVLIHAIWDVWIVGYLLGVACLIAMYIAVKERLQVKEFRTNLVLRRTWRIYFLILSLAYVVLILIGLIWRIVEFTS